MKQITLAILGMVFILWPCRADAPLTAEVGERQVAWYGAGHVFQEIKVFQAGDHNASIATVAVNYGDSRHDVSEHYVELLNLPLDWQKIEAPSPDRTSLLVLERGQPSVSIPKTDKNNFWFTRHPWFSLFFVLLGFYAVFAIGLSGGPNHGEHPFILNVCHLAGFLFLARAWDNNYYYTYLAILVSALALSVYAIRIRIWDQPKRTWLFRGLVSGCYLALFLIIQTKSYSNYAAWSSPGSLHFYVPKQDRGPVQVLGEKEKVLAEFSLTSGIDCRTILFWNEKEDAKALKVASPRGSSILLELRKPNINPNKPAAK
ncbi:MAG: hypothetical protein EHM45_02235 [Desulfobacteraceae bacterium]|nr:MAG: hypothetical protein EHM45_02235 [Desulfobacteraceae bacterium]